jgi:hypothetical protein
MIEVDINFINANQPQGENQTGLNGYTKGNLHLRVLKLPTTLTHCRSAGNRITAARPQS